VTLFLIKVSIGFTFFFNSCLLCDCFTAALSVSVARRGHYTKEQNYNNDFAINVFELSLNKNVLWHKLQRLGFYSQYVSACWPLVVLRALE
jgi:hypothetical protein